MSKKFWATIAILSVVLVGLGGYMASDLYQHYRLIGLRGSQPEVQKSAPQQASQPPKLATSEQETSDIAQAANQALGNTQVLKQKFDELKKDFEEVLQKESTSLSAARAAPTVTPPPVLLPQTSQASVPAASKVEETAPQPVIPKVASLPPSAPAPQVWSPPKALISQAQAALVAPLHQSLPPPTPAPPPLPPAHVEQAVQVAQGGPSCTPGEHFANAPGTFGIGVVVHQGLGALQALANGNKFYPNEMVAVQKAAAEGKAEKLDGEVTIVLHLKNVGKLPDTLPYLVGKNVCHGVVEVKHLGDCCEDITLHVRGGEELGQLSIILPSSAVHLDTLACLEPDFVPLGAPVITDGSFKGNVCGLPGSKPGTTKLGERAQAGALYETFAFVRGGST